MSHFTHTTLAKDFLSCQWRATELEYDPWPDLTWNNDSGRTRLSKLQSSCDSQYASHVLLLCWGIIPKLHYFDTSWTCCWTTSLEGCTQRQKWTGQWTS